jgi:hypothetical protein
MLIVRMFVLGRFTALRTSVTCIFLTLICVSHTFATKDNYSTSLSVDFTTSGSCANSPVTFVATVTPTADSLIWSFGDGTISKGWNPVHTYAAGGSYVVSVVAYLNGETTNVSHTINLTAFDLQLILPADTTGCLCDFPRNEYLCGTTNPFEVTVSTKGSSPPTYQWFGPGGILPGQTTETLEADSAGYYYVVATGAQCSAYAGVNIKQYDSLDRRGNVWFFGQNAGINFDPLPESGPYGITGPLHTPEGSSAISNRNGQLIFSTDGHSIFDKEYADITPPGGLGGEITSTQSVLIIPVPGDETLYYIFTTTAISGSAGAELRYSLFDSKLNNGYGGLVSYNQLLLSNSTERLTGNSNWLIAHEYGNNVFRAYRITREGISNPVRSPIGSVHSASIPQHGKGYMKLGGQSRLAVALATPGVSNNVEVFDFNSSNGIVTNFRIARLNNAAGHVYGVEFSPAGNKLFATLIDGPNSRLYEFSIQGFPLIIMKQNIAQAGNFGAMQSAYDGQIYIAIDGSASLGTFVAMEDTTAVSPLSALQSFELGWGTTSTLGLPNFIHNVSYSNSFPGFTLAGSCVGDSTEFYATGKDPAIDKFDWVFGDSQSAIDSGAQISHLYPGVGTYTVTLRIYNKCETPLGTFTQQFFNNNVPPDASNAVALCMGPALIDANPQDVPGLSYLWSTGETTEVISVSQQAAYEVTVTDDDTGCSTDATVLAISNQPAIELGTDQTVCMHSTFPLLDAENPGATHAWTINLAANGNTSRTQAVDTSVPGIFKYIVRVTDPVTACFAQDSVVYTIKEQPAKPGISSDGGLLTSDSDSGNQWYRNGIAIAGATGKSYEAKDPGSYTVRVTVGGCSAISDPTTITAIEESTRPLISVYPNPTRESVTIELDYDPTIMAAELFSVVGIRKETTAFVVEGGRLVAEIEMTQYPSGLYLVFIRSRNGHEVVKVMKE